MVGFRRGSVNSPSHSSRPWLLLRQWAFSRERIFSFGLFSPRERKEGNWKLRFSSKQSKISTSARMIAGSLSGGRALRTRPEFSTMSLHPLTQDLVDARLPPRAGGSEVPQHLRGQTDVGMHLRIGFLRSTARASKRAL